MDGAGGKTIRERFEDRFLDRKNPFGAAVITDRLAAEFTANAGGTVQTTERRLRAIIAQAVELGAKQHRTFVEAERQEDARRATAAWPSQQWREGLRRLYLASLGAWGCGLGVFLLSLLEQRSSMTPEMAIGQWAWGMAIPAAVVFGLYRAGIWIGSGFRGGPAPRT